MTKKLCSGDDSMYISNQLPIQLEKEKELELYQRCLNGDNSAKSLLINHNLQLVVAIAKKIGEDKPFHLEDLTTVGTIGLIKGVQIPSSEDVSLRKHLAQSIANEIEIFISKRKK